MQPLLVSDIVPDLRAATGAAHQRLEQTVDIVRCVADAARYRKLLERFLGFYRPLERRLTKLGGWEAHGGMIHVSSEGAGRGASFRVELEAMAPPADAAGPTAQATTGRTVVNGQGLTVLLVEDHADSARVLSTLLRRRGGYEVIHADTAAKAEVIFQTTAVNFVVSDVGLPDGNGLELIKKLRAVRPVPCIVLSGYGMETDLAGSLEAGAQAYLIKPVSWPDLEAALQRLSAG